MASGSEPRTHYRVVSRDTYRENEVEDSSDDESKSVGSEASAKSNGSGDSEKEYFLNIPDDATQRDVVFRKRFGRPGASQVLRATHFSGKTTRDFDMPCTIDWHLKVGATDLARLLHGYESNIMDDKWHVYADGPDASGFATINFHRSWTGRKIAALGVQLDWGDDGEAAVWTGEIRTLTTEKDVQGYIEGESGVDYVKFQILVVLERVLEMSPLAEIVEPQSWLDMANQRVAASEYASHRVYRGLTVSEDTQQDIDRLGGMEEVFRTTEVLFNN